ncbi:dihydropteroate synthase [Oleiagrimonas sp. C23AA]|uniref:dihydropteroate synthase n=1 Tax=Oleiagrimonas sp. C23AA TaxID=2719047 RepID=UPI001421AEEC|nr:dihydropteroate synthase [Oleiagrimonas sp. C23AA]NII10926.1 dihydropteroate synthase [Oleiagrimonas sp. C23AA]
MFARTLDCNGRPLTLDRTRVVGVLNITPDSFSDGGRFVDHDAALEHALAMVEAGADMIDVGGESTRPGAAEVGPDEELQRVVPLIERLAAASDVAIGIDTSKPDVMRAAVGAGAGLINDVYALRREGALETAAALGVPVCVMHMQGQPRDMQAAPAYDDVVGEVHRFLAERVFACQMAGIDVNQVLVDPGFGFGKTLEHNLELLRQLERFDNLGGGLYVGLSRKSMIGALTGRETPGERGAGSVAAALIAAQRGAHLVRVHDVAPTRDALAVWQAVHQGDRPAVSPTPAPPRWPDDD